MNPRRLVIVVSLSGFLSLGAWHGPTQAAESLEQMLNRANEAAASQNYAVAIPLYEQAVQKAPSEKVLKNNLAVLYANQGVTLQEQKKFEEAIRCFDKALALVAPDSREGKQTLQAKAGTYYTQAMDLRDTLENPTPADYARMHALLDQALALNPEEPNFKKAKASVYLDEAYRLAVEEKFTEALPLLANAQAIDPASRSVKQSLANVYLGLAKQNPDQQDAWLEKALATDDSPRIKQVADMLRNPAQAESQRAPGGFAKSPDEAKNAAPRELSTLSIAEMLHDLEAQLQLKPAKGATLLERLETVEKQIYGKPKEGALATRAKNAYVALMGSMNGHLAESNPHLIQAPVRNSENSYLAEIFKVTDGKVIRWGKFPLRVHVETPKDQPLFKDEYKEAVLHGFNAWKVKSNGFVNYVEVKNPDSADIVVNWSEDYVDRFADPEHVPDVYKNYSPPKRSKLMNVIQVASMFAPGYFSLAPQALAAGMQYQQMKKLQVIRDESKITLGLAPLKDLSPEAAKTLLQNMAAKEFGHALGLKGSSDKPGDLLYPELRSDMAQLPSQRDLETLRELYNRPPNIILNVR